MNTSPSEKLKPNEAQRLLLTLTQRAMKQIDCASRAPLARDRSRAMARLNRAIEILSSDAKKIAA